MNLFGINWSNIFSDWFVNPIKNLFSDKKKSQTSIMGNLAKKESPGDTVSFSSKNREKNYKYLNTRARGDVYDLTNEHLGSFSVSSNTVPCIIKTGDKEQPFKMDNDVEFRIEYVDNNKKRQTYKIPVKKGYSWDGASIPKLAQYVVGDNDKPEYMIASLVHDKMCENHDLVDNNRPLSSAVFGALLKKNNTSDTMASTMTNAVDLYQATFNDWEDKNKPA